MEADPVTRKYEFMDDFAIFDVPAGRGRLGISPMPGRHGDLAADIQTICDWGADLVISMTPLDEMRSKGGADLPSALATNGIRWLNVPIVDFAAPDHDGDVLWRVTSPFAHQMLMGGGRVLVHCFGGCGRSGMAAVRLLVELGQGAEQAVTLVRSVRPCAIETPQQLAWATQITQ